MSLDIPLPKQVFGHPWLLMNDGKMSKSKGNVIYADHLVKHFGVDAVRYYLLHEIPFSADGVISYELLIERINSDLVNILGNLVNRTITMGIKYFDGKITNKKENREVDDNLINLINNLDKNIELKMDKLEIGNAIDQIFEVLRSSNKYIDDTTPWVLAKDDNSKNRLETVIYNLLEAIRVCAVFIKPFLPETSDNILNQLNTKDNSFNFNDHNIYQLNNPSILFQRIDCAQKLKEIEEDKNNE